MGNAEYRRLMSIVIVCSVFFVSFSASSQGANAWLSGWSYAKEHIVWGTTAGAQTNYQMRVKVHRVAGTDGMPAAEDVYVGTDCQADFDDIRFTDSDGSTELDYWLESVNGDVATFWVEIPNIPASPGSTKIYMYYGNAGASSTTNGDDTFVFFDNFDTDKWTDANPSWVYVDTANSRMYIHTDRDRTDDYSYVSQAVPSDFEYKFRYYEDSEAGNCVVNVGLSSTASGTRDTINDAIFFEFYGGSSTQCSGGPTYKLHIRLGGASVTSSYYCGSLDVWYVVYVRKVGNTAYVELWNSAETTKYLDVSLDVTGIPALNYLYVGGVYTASGGHDAYAFKDSARLRKYASPEPAHGSWSVYIPCTASPSGGASWLSGDWQYRKGHAICSAAGAGTNYQMRVVVHSGSGTDDGKNVYLNGHSANWPNDIRFTDDDGSTELDYWMADSDASMATFWVKVADDLGTADRTMWIYYGNGGAGSNSDFSSVTEAELVNPGFEDTATCLETNPTGWTHIAAQASNDCWEVESGFVHSGSNAFGNHYSCDNQCADDEGQADVWPNVLVRQDLTLPTDGQYLINASYWFTGATHDGSACTDYALGEDDSRLHFFALDSGSAQIGEYKGPTFSNLGIVLGMGTWGYQTVEWITPADTKTIRLQADGIDGGAGVCTTDDQYDGGNAGGYYDDFFLFIRKFTSPEPAHGNWGAEDEVNTAPILTSISTSSAEVEEFSIYNVTPVGMGDADGDNLHMYCCQDTTNTCTPTAASNECHRDITWLPPYSGVVCLLTSPNVSANTTYYSRCRAYDGEDYSPTRSASYLVRKPAYSETWSHKKAHEIIGGTGSQTDYQMRVRVHRATGVDSGDDVYVGTKCRPDFGDIRFTTYNNSNPLAYWIESIVGDTATFHIRIPYIPNPSSVDIIMFYGNLAAETTSNAENTFDFFDDFDDGVIDGGNWGMSTQGSGASYVETGGNLELTSSNSLTGSASARTIPSFTNDIAIEYRAMSNNERYYDVALGYGSIVANDDCGSSNWWHTTLEKAYSGNVQNNINSIYRFMDCPNPGTNLQNNIDGPDAGSYYYWRITYGASGDWNWYWSDDDGATWNLLGDEHTETTHLNDAKSILFSRGGYSGGSYGGTFFIDWVRVSKYSEGGPANGEWYELENPKWNDTKWHLGSNVTTAAVGSGVKLYAQGMDDTALDRAWLSVNEIGVWKNYSIPYIDGSWVNTTGLAGLWHFDSESSGVTPDSSDNGNGGTLYGDTLLTQGGRHGAGGMKFDGSGDYIDMGNANVFDITDTVTISAWVKPADRPAPAASFWGLVGKKTSHAAVDGYTLVMGSWGDECSRWCFRINDQSLCPSTACEELGRWDHLVGVYNGTDMMLYQNGTLKGTKHYVSPIGITANSLRVGYVNGYQYFNGDIDDVAIWNRPLSAREIEQIYTGKYGSPMNLTKDDSKQWTNFTWHNPDVPLGTVVRWKVYYFDTSGNQNVTKESSFMVSSPIPNIEYLSYSGDIDRMEVSWVTGYDAPAADLIEMSCELNGLQHCTPKDFVPELDESWVNMDGLVGYWKFNEGAGTTVYDSSGKGYDGSLFGTVLGDFEGDLDGWTASCGGGSEVIQLTTDAYEGSGAVEIVLGCIYKAVTAVDGQNLYYAVKPTGGNYENPCLWAESECKNTRPAELVETIGDWSIYKTRSEYDGAAGWHLYGASGTIYDFITMSPIWTEGKYWGALEFDGIDDRADIPFAEDLTSGYTVNMWFKPDEVQNTIPLTYQSQDNDGDTGEDYSGDLGRSGRRGLKDTHAAGNLVYANLGSGWDGPFSLTHLSRVADNTQAVQAWEYRVKEDGVVRWSYSKNANDYASTDYRWWESPIWVFEPTKTYELELYWPGNVDFYSDRIAVMSRRAGILRVGQFRCMFNRYDDYLDVGFYTRKSDTTWDSSGRWVYNVVPLTGWHMVTWMHDGTSKEIYVDGELKANWEGVGDIYDSSGILRVGYGWMYWLGAIDDVSIWNRSLSGSEVLKIYEGAHSHIGPSGAGSCQFLSPSYDLSQNMTSEETKSVINSVNCTACNINDLSRCSSRKEWFHPVKFDANMPNEVSMPVGSSENIPITLTNNGMLTDNFLLDVVSLNPSGLEISGGTQTVQALTTDNFRTVYFGATVLTSEQKSTARLTATSEVSSISLQREMSTSGQDRVLSDFGWLGILQVIVVSAVLVFLLL